MEYGEGAQCVPYMPDGYQVKRSKGVPAISDGHPSKGVQRVPYQPDRDQVNVSKVFLINQTCIQ